MSAVSIRLSRDTAAVQCDRCGRGSSFATADHRELVDQVRDFLRTHETCARLRDADAG